MPFSLDSSSRKQILEFVRPLSVGLDGMTEFGFVERRIAIVARLLAATRSRTPDLAIDEGRLFLLACFQGIAKGRVSSGGRTELLLASAGVPSGELQALQRSLKRMEADPRTIEEKLVHDAALLESVGAYGVTQALVEGTRERMTLVEMAGEIQQRMDGAAFSTDEAREFAHDRVEFARLFSRRLREEALEFASGMKT